MTWFFWTDYTYEYTITIYICVCVCVCVCVEEQFQYIYIYIYIYIYMQIKQRSYVLNKNKAISTFNDQLPKLHTSAAITHLLKAKLIYLFERHGLLLRGSQSYGNLIRMHHANETLEKGLVGDTQECYMLFWTNLWNNTNKTTVVRSLTAHLTNHPSNTDMTCWALPEK